MTVSANDQEECRSLLPGFYWVLSCRAALSRLMLYVSTHPDALHLLTPTLGLLQGHCECFFHPHLPSRVRFQDSFEQF
jgi:hypothetical protein